MISGRPRTSARWQKRQVFAPEKSISDNIRTLQSNYSCRNVVGLEYDAEPMRCSPCFVAEEDSNERASDLLCNVELYRIIATLQYL